MNSFVSVAGESLIYLTGVYNDVHEHGHGRVGGSKVVGQASNMPASLSVVIARLRVAVGRRAGRRVRVSSAGLARRNSGR